MSFLMTRGHRLLLAAGLSLGLGTLGPATASAKTFTAYPKDDAGDSVDGPRDIVESRIAYNRKSGALSVQITMAEAIDAGPHDAIYAVVLSNLVNGKCMKPTFVIGGALSSPQRVFAQRYDQGRLVGKRRWGSASIDDTTISLRVRNRSLAGDTVGCTGVVLMSTVEKDAGGQPVVLDMTAGNDGFI